MYHLKFYTERNSHANFYYIALKRGNSVLNCKSIQNNKIQHNVAVNRRKDIWLLLVFKMKQF